ncbi:MAG TPA: TonB-dependent receptor [Nevskiaceae bacterium]|nr:TonB-dependent receptor [Nevskiaceae bacterium]
MKSRFPRCRASAVAFAAAISAMAQAQEEISPGVDPAGAPVDTIAVDQPGTAEPAPADAPVEGGGIQEIVVTAAYREQGIQDVVGSAQVFSGAQLDEKGVASMQDYLLEVPSVSLEKSGNGSSKISMRGISNVNASDLGYAGGSPTTGVYLDNVAIQGSGVFPDLNLFDLQRIEILKGPQGTLYGEGSMGGAIKMVTNPVDLEEWAVRTQAMVSQTTDGSPSREFRAAVNAPIVTDKLGARLVVAQRHSGGFVDYTELDDEDANTAEDLSIRGVLRYQPTDTLGLSYMYFGDDNDIDQFPVVDEGRQDDLTNSRVENQYSNTNFSIHALTATWDLPFAQLTSVSAMYDTRRNTRRRTPVLQSLLQTQFRQLGLTAPDLFSNASTHVITKLDSFSQELRLVSAGDERLDWIGGVFYRDREQSFDQSKYEDSVPEDPTGLFTGLLGGFNPLQGKQEEGFGNEEFDQVAAYGEVNYELTDTIELTGGLRAFREKVSFFIDTNFYGAEAFLIGTDPGNIDPETGTAHVYFAQKIKTDGILPKVSASWHLTDEHMVYATFSRGFRSGAANVYSALESGPPIIKPDYVWNKELGAKLTWLDGHLVTNFAVYHIDWQDLQGTVLGTARLGIVPTDFAHLDNAGDAEVYGAEASTIWSPLAGLQLMLNLGYNHGEITKPRAESQVVEGAALPSNPKYSGSATASYSRDVLGLTASASTTYSYTDEQHIVFETEELGTLTIDGYGLLKANLGIGGDNWQVQLFGDNLTNEHAITTISAPIAQYTVITPRTLGVRISYDF